MHIAVVCIVNFISCYKVYEFAMLYAASVDQEIAYQFDCRYVAVMKKKYNKHKARGL